MKKIANILSALSITDEKRNHLLETLVNSDLSIEDIKETYDPIITNKKNNSKDNKNSNKGNNKKNNQRKNETG
jgi:hypothetical protein